MQINGMRIGDENKNACARQQAYQKLGKLYIWVVCSNANQKRQCK
jgi:hypothetical protein